VRLATVVMPAADESPAAAVIDGDQAVVLHRAEPTLPRSMVALLAAWHQGAGDLTRGVVDSGRGRVGLADVRLRAPILRPPFIWGVAKNYPDHASELDSEVPSFPALFAKAPGAVIGPGDAISIPVTEHQPFVDHEVELAVVIGRRCHGVTAAEAPSVVAGYTICNDVTERVWQKASTQMTLGKSFDTFAPMGPWLVTADEIDDPHRLRLSCQVNGETMQDASTAEMIFDCWRLIEIITTAATLEPGTVITTGTPAGVGAARGVALQPGDTVRCEVERIGVLENPIRALPSP